MIRILAPLAVTLITSVWSISPLHAQSGPGKKNMLVLFFSKSDHPEMMVPVFFKERSEKQNPRTLEV